VKKLISGGVAVADVYDWSARLRSCWVACIDLASASISVHVGVHVSDMLPQGFLIPLPATFPGLSPSLSRCLEYTTSIFQIKSCISFGSVL